MKQIIALGWLLVALAGCSKASDASDANAPQSAGISGSTDSSGDLTSLSDEQLEIRYRNDIAGVLRKHPDWDVNTLAGIGNLASYKERERRSTLAQEQQLKTAAQEEAVRSKQVATENARHDRQMALDEAKSEKETNDYREAAEREGQEAEAADIHILDQRRAEDLRQEKLRAEQQPHP